MSVIGKMNKTKFILTFLINVCLALSQAGVTQHCGLGEFLNVSGQSPVCQRCPNDTYKDVANHNNTDCKLCKIYSPAKDRVANFENCTRFHKAIIINCSEGYKLDEKVYECILCRQVVCRNNPVTSDTSTVEAESWTTIPGLLGTSTTMKPSTSASNQVNRTSEDVNGGDRSSGQLHGEAIAGIVAGTVLLLVIVVVVVGVCCWKRHVNRGHVYLAANTDAPAEDKSTADAHIPNGVTTGVDVRGEGITQV
ncbi:hypothetical protein Btru_039851 [Bulinus truncatus]|nr:hypothetical protein Btru_039851 [Bulinus truncatus]